MKLTLHLISAILLAASPFHGAFGQDVVVSGRVVTEDGQGLGYVNIKLSVLDSIVTGDVSDSMGYFRIPVSPGIYALATKTWGYDSYTKEIDAQSDVELGNVTVKISKDITEVEITARKPLMVREVDRIRINVSNTILADGDAWEMLRLSPGVLADANGNLMMQGKSDIQVMLDGRPLNLSGPDLQAFLSGLSAEDVASIELITSPPASMMASGSGVINIVMKRVAKDNFSANLHQQFKRGVFNKYKLGGSFLASYNKWYVQVSASFNQRKDLLNERNSIGFFGDSGLEANWQEESSRTSQSQNPNFSAFVEYQLTPKSSISLRSTGNFVPQFESNTSATTMMENAFSMQDSSISNVISADGLSNYVDGYLGYKYEWAKIKLSTGIDYTRFRKDRNQRVSSDFFDNTGSFLLNSSFVQQADQDISILGARLDLEQSLPKGGILEYGITGSTIQTENTANYSQLILGEWEEDSLLSNLFNYQENNFGAYVSLAGQFKEWKYKLGLRTEYTQLQGASRNQSESIDLDYWRLFPVVNAQKQLTEDLSLGLSYNQRINRPSYKYLNAFRVYSSPYSYTEGNPFLLPSITRKIEANWIWKYNYYFAVFGENISDPIEEISIQDNENRTISYSAINLNNSLRAGISHNGSMDLTSWWSIYWDVTGYFQRFEFAAPFTGELVVNNGIFVNPFFWSGFTIKALGDLSLEWEFNYLSPIYQGAILIQQRSEFSVGVKKRFLKDRLRASLFVADLFDQNKFTLESDYALQSNIFREDPENQFVRLSLVWKLGMQKIKKKPEQKINTGEKQRL